MSFVSPTLGTIVVVTVLSTWARCDLVARDGIVTVAKDIKMEDVLVGWGLLCSDGNRGIGLDGIKGFGDDRRL